MTRVGVSILGIGLLVAVAGCGRESPSDHRPQRLEVDVFADTGRAERLVIRPPDTAGYHATASVWLTQVAPVRAAVSEPPLPEATPAALDTGLPAPPALAVDPDLKPPILRAPGRLRVPPGRRRAVVELDVRVAEDGTTSDALWAGGSSDSALVAAATECALEMRFYPALRLGLPVAVWCRQRFDFESR